MFMNLTDVRGFLREHLRKEAEMYYGLQDAKFIDQVTNNWFDDQNNYDGRWAIIRERVPSIGRVLDMAAGCGTFVLYGLHHGYDAWGVEPVEWKREYFRKKVLVSTYPAEFLAHIVSGVGEALPFENESFDVITTYQTLEHVQNVNMCIKEMLRVLKPGGILYIKAPDYNCFFEPHYRVPFLPKMNKKLAAVYLRLIGKPALGLDALQWVTENQVTQFLRRSEYNVQIERTSQYYSDGRQKRIRTLLPEFLRNIYIIRCLNFVYELRSKLTGLAKICREEINVDLWVRKLL